MYTRHGHIRHPYVEGIVRDGRVLEGTFSFQEKSGEETGSASLEGGELTATRGRLIGTVRATVAAGDAAHGTYIFSLDVPITTNYVHGEYETSKDGEDWGRHGVTGTVCGMGKVQGDAVLHLVLDRGIEGRQPLTVLVNRRGGRLTGGIAVGGNQALHRVRADSLRIEENRVTGTVRVTIAPDGGFPPGGHPVQCAYQVDAKVGAEGQVDGTFSGDYGLRHRRHGKVDGTILDVAQLWLEFGRSAE
jgi:hypothetical protein